MGDNGNTQVKSTQARKTANYLVSSYGDLRDVVLTVEKMILDHKEIRDKNLLRRGCDVQIVPLAERGGWVVRVKLHPDM